MGILVNDSAVNVRFRIRSGDPEDFFKAEAERVGDFIFLVLRTRTSNLNQNVLNRERTPHYDLDVRAKFKSGKKKTSAALPIPEARAVVRVEVVDVNDLDPFFAPSRYEFSVTEDSPLHSSVGRVRAEDADSGINAEVYYNLVGEELASSSFAVNPVTGAISLTRPLSFKERPRFDLRVAAKDRGPKSRFASTQPDTATVSIRVEQVSAKHVSCLHRGHAFCSRFLFCHGHVSAAPR
jgi:protocadherin Fat 1/2/3